MARSAIGTPEQKKLYNAFEANPMYWSYFFFPEAFRDNPPDFHLEIIKAALKYKKLAIAAPRESSKTTLIQYYAFQRLLFQKIRYLVIVGNTEDKAKEYLDTYKRELKDNKNLRRFVGKHWLPVRKETDTTFRFNNGYECMVSARGIGQIPGIRGTKFHNWRPDLIIGDDMDDDELVRSRDRRIKLQEDFDTALVPAGDRHLCQYICIGTILHDDCQIAKLLRPDEYTDWKKMLYRACDEETQVSLWREKWSYADLQKIKESKPLTYAKEYQNNPIAGGNRVFEKEYFNRWRVQNNIACLLNNDGSIQKSYHLHELTSAIGVDLAWSDAKSADESVFCGIFITPEKDILVDNYITRKGLRPDTFCDIIFPMVEKYEQLTNKMVPVGFEKAMLERVMKWFLKREMRKRDRYMITRPIDWKARDKIARITSVLQPRYSNGIIFHGPNMGELEHQLLRFPYGSHDDIIDALQGAIQISRTPSKTVPKKQHPDYDEGFEMLKESIAESKPKKRKIGKFKLSKRKWEIPSQRGY